MKHERFYALNPDFFLFWKTNVGEEEIFDCVIIKDKKIMKVMIITPFYKEFLLVNGNYEKFDAGQDVKVKLKF